jgi:TolB-like protein
MSDQPTDTEVRAALARIVSAPTFARARRAQSFLCFVSEETLAGRAHTVNGHRIATAVFGRPAHFDAVNDPLVRVEAGRLRSRLCEYYATTGSGDPVRIELKPGSYVPVFTFAAPARHRAERSWARAAWAIALPAALVVVVVAAAVGIGRGEREPAAVSLPQTAPRVRVEPFRPDDSPETAHLALGITEEVLVRLGAYRDVQILVAAPVDAPALDTSADIVLSGSVSAVGDMIRVVPRLVDAQTGQEIWTSIYDGPLAADSVWTVVDAVAGAVAAAVGEPYGPMFDAEVRRTALATSSDPYHCLLRFVFALRVISEGAHGRATACFEEAVATDPRSSMSWARLAALYRMEYLHGFNVKADALPPLDRAEDAARRALDADAENPFAHQEMAFLCLLRDDHAGFEHFVTRTLELHPSADIRAALGINFVKMGEVERGLALIDQGIADSPRAPPFFYLGYVVQALRSKDYEAAYASAQRMATRDWPLSQAVLAAVAALAGDPERAREAEERLIELRPAFATTGRELIARGRLGADVESELFRGLALAGLDLY